MCKLKNSLIIAVIHIKRWKRTPRALIVLTGIFLIGYFSARPYRDIMANLQTYMTAYEVSALVITAQSLYAVILYLYLISDVPIDTDVRNFIITKTGRFGFLLGEEFYMIFAAAVFMLIPRLGGIIAIYPQLSFSALWSKTGLSMLQLPETPEISAVWVSTLSYLKGIIYCIVLGNVVIIGNSCFKSNYGFMLGVYLHGLFWAMTLDGIWGKWSLFSTALVSLDIFSDLITIAMNLLLAYGMLLVTGAVLKHDKIIGGRHD